MKYADAHISRPATGTTEDALLFQALENAPEAFYCVDGEGVLAYVNAHGRALLDLTLEETRNRTILDVIPALSLERWQKATQAAKERGEWFIRTSQCHHTDKKVPIELCIGYQHIEATDYFYCFARVLSEESQSERLLALIAQATAAFSGQSFLETLMQQMARAMHVRIAFITECLDQPPSRVRMLAFWSANKLEENLEYDLAGTPCDEVINEKRNVHIKSSLGECYPKDKGFAESYFAVPIYDATGDKVIGHMAILDDEELPSEALNCTAFEILASRASVELQRMQAEELLRKSEEKYRLLIENQTDLIMRLDIDGKMTFVSLTCCTELRKSESELLGAEFLTHIHKEELDRAKEAWQGVLSPPHKKSCELRILTSQGWRWFAWSFKGIVDDDGRVTEVIAVGRDVSKRHQAEDQSRKTMQQLAHVGRMSSMGELASGMAHELNQPLTAIMSFAQAARRMLDLDATNLEELKPVMERIAANADNAGQIIRRMRTFAKKGDTKKISVDLQSLITEVISLLGTEIRHNEIILTLVIDKNIPLVVADPIQVQQVLVNLVHNAIEAISDHQSPIREVHISANLASSKLIAVEVRDTGPGISMTQSNQVFDPFFTTKTKGLGVGLSICQTIIETHGGKLTLGSTCGKGATFCFTLPVDGKE